jgi:hypothetical protein
MFPSNSTKTCSHRNPAQELLPKALWHVMPDGVYSGRPEGILARRKELQVQPLVARRERCRGMTGTVENAGARTPEVHLNSPPGLCHNR